MQCRLFHLPDSAVLPNFGDGGLYGLARDLRSWLHNASMPAPAFVCESSAKRKTLVLLVIDGLGDAFLQRHGQGSVILRHRKRRLTSVFPSTTASAVTTLLTGLAPAQHGLTGWFIHDRRFGGVIAPLPLYQRGAGRLRQPFLVQRLFPYRGMFAGARRPSIMVSPREIAFSAYSRRHARGATIVPYASPRDFASTVATEVGRLGQGGGFIHAYYPHFDTICHAFGAHSEPALAEFAFIDQAFATLLDRLEGSSTTVLLTADHGFIDAPNERHLRLEHLRPAASMLAAPLFGERRVAFCALRPGADDEFRAFVKSNLAGKAAVVSAERFIRSGMLGPGPQHRRLAERCGTQVLLLEPGWTISDRVAGESSHHMVGVHGGLSADEMWVPLIEVQA